jgi:hypothetical protein
MVYQRNVKKGKRGAFHISEGNLKEFVSGTEVENKGACPQSTDCGHY